jgi:hypothetical protein
MLRFTFAIFLLLPIVQITAQEVTPQQSYWTRIYLQGKINEKWAWNLETDERRLIRPDRQLQFIAHAHIQIKPNPSLVIAGGTTYSLVNDIPEWRLFQEFYWTVPLTKKLKITNRFRTEQRSFHVTESNWQLRLRWRYRLQLAYTVNPKIILKCSDEYMWQDDNFDQNRIYAAIEYRFSKHFSCEMGYLKLYQRRKDNLFFNRDILRTTFYFYV